ncbi:MAG: hypothetical protein KIS92_03780 [Planctomycetota bacterium]|nr:hypothetical protein [Planctomycetota bacterium]
MLDTNKIVEAPCAVRAVTRGPKHHFFGYYDRNPWDATGRYMLALETEFIDRPPTAEDQATVCLVDTHDDDRLMPLAETYAWNWQMGCNMMWLPTAPDREIVYNARENGRWVSVIRDVFSGKTRTLPRAVAHVSPDGHWAVSINYARIARERPGYGYQGVADDWADQCAPDGDGVWLMDLRTGEHKLALSLAQCAAIKPLPTMAGVHHRIYDLRFSPNSERVNFIHRWRRAGQPAAGGHHTRWISMHREGRDVFVINDHDHVSHNCWYDDATLLSWARRSGRGDHYYLNKDRVDEEPAILGEHVFDQDGHCTYSPDKKWMLTDTYPDKEQFRHLMLYRVADGTRFNLGKFYARKEIGGEIRSDLHPRFSRDGKLVAIDSIHEGPRQMYVVDVAKVVAREA